MHLLMKLMKVIIIVAGSINFVKVEQHSISIVETNDILPTQVLTILEFTYFRGFMGLWKSTKKWEGGHNFKTNEHIKRIRPPSA